jgi:hypothetical protein
MAADAGTPQRFNSAKAAAVQIGKVRAAFDPKWKDVTTKLRAAIKEKEADKIDLYLSALDGQLKSLNKALRAATVTRGSLREVELDEDFVAANLKAVDAAVTIVSDAVKSFATQYDEGKTLQNEAEKAGARFSGGADQAMITLSGLEEEMEDEKGELTGLFKKQDMVAQRAADAAESHDAKGLDKAQKEHAGLGIDITLTLYDGYVKQMRKFGAEAAASKEYSKELKEKLADGIADIERKVGTTDSYARMLRDSVKRVKELKIEEIDLAKAAKTLSLDKANEALMKKVLLGPSVGYELGLDQIGKKLDPKQKGKDMLARLKSAGVV